MLPKANIRFRWVQCQLDYLSTLDRDVARRAAVNSLPPGLPETYKQTLDRIPRNDESYYDIATKALAWLVYCVRPLTLSELAIAAVIDPEKPFDEEDEFDSPTDILKYCGSLLRFNEATKIVEISHISVSQFLKSQALPDGSTNPYYIDEAKGHLLIMKTCFSWLVSSRFNELSGDMASDLDQRFRSDFSIYSIYEWPTHASKVERLEDAVQSILSFLSHPDVKSTLGWVGLWEVYEGASQNKMWWKNEIYRGRLQANPVRGRPSCELYYAALFGFRSVVQTLLDSGLEHNQPGGFHGSPLTAAERNGHKDVYSLLSSRDRRTTSIHPVTPENDVPNVRNETDPPLPIYPIRGPKKTNAPLVDIGVNMSKKYANFAAILRRASQAGVTHIVIKGTNYMSSREALEICQRFDGQDNITLRCTVGIHPSRATTTLGGDHAKTFTKGLENLIRSETGQRYCVAVGECGLDYSGKSVVPLHQKQVFRKHLELAERLHLPIFCHSRDSHDDFSEFSSHIWGG